jgi:multiple sugar transport system permease protein
MNRQVNFLFKLIFIVLVVGIGFYSAFPIYWMIVCSLKPYVQLFTKVSIFPWPFSTESYKGLLTMTNYPTYFKNSVIVAVGTTIITVFTVCPLSYILTRLRIRFAGTFVRLMLVAYMFPALLLTIPMFVIFTKVGLFDTLTSVMIGQSTLTIPLGVWLMWGFFKGIPFELEEAALIDGSTPFGAFIKIVLPLSRAGLITTALFTFILSWTDYIYAFTLIFSDELKTLPIGLADIYGATDMRWGELMAGSALITIPSVLAFAFVTRYLVQGLTAGAVKG